MSILQGRTRVHPRINISNDALFGSAPIPELAHKKVPAQLHKKKNIHLRIDMSETTPQENTCYWQEHPTLQMSDEHDSATKELDLYISCGTTVAQVVDLVTHADIRDKQLLSTVPEIAAKLISGKNVHFEDGVLFDGPADIGKDTKRISELGSGASGFVSLALYLPLLKLVAVKEITVHNAQERQMVKNELHALHSNLSKMDTTSFQSRIHRSLHAHRELSKYQSGGDSSPFLVSFYGAYPAPCRNSISIVMDFMDMGSVQNMLDQPNDFILSEDLIRHVAYCCVHALQHMHSKCLLHKDLKPANILLNRKGEFKVADFGLATILSKSTTFCSEFEGTMMYMSPERITGQPYSYSCDIWSLGVVLFCLATGKYPFDTQDGFFGLEEAIVNDPLPPLPNFYSADCRLFIKSLLSKDPTKRLTAKQALAHPFIASYSIGSHQWMQFINHWQKKASEVHLDEKTIASIAKMIPGDESAQASNMLRNLQQQGLNSNNLPSRLSNTKPVRKNALAQLAGSCGISQRRLEELVQKLRMS